VGARCLPWRAGRTCFFHSTRAWWVSPIRPDTRLSLDELTPHINLLSPAFTNFGSHSGVFATTHCASTVGQTHNTHSSRESYCRHNTTVRASVQSLYPIPVKSRSAVGLLFRFRARDLHRLPPPHTAFVYRLLPRLREITLFPTRQHLPPDIPNLLFTNSVAGTCCSSSAIVKYVPVSEL
jgi:hypothetical protein